MCRLQGRAVQAIKSSDCYTDDIEQAQAVYVYDYCYYIWWLATLHSRGGDMKESPGDYLIRVWSMLQMHEPSLHRLTLELAACWRP